MSFQIYDLDGFLVVRAETVGSKEKFWVEPPPTHALGKGPFLFKIGRPMTGENWAEIVAHHIAKAMGLPCATYHFARYQNQIGVISEIFYPYKGRFVPINIVLSSVESGYDDTMKYKQIQYTLEKSLSLLKVMTQKPPLDSGLVSSVQAFVGYLVYDVLIGNTDRHHENWGLVVELGRKQITLAPTFDHASSLGRNLTDENRAFRLSEIDPRATVKAYANRARTAFFSDVGTGKTLSMREMVEGLMKMEPEVTRFWANRALGLDHTHFGRIFQQVPTECMSDVAADFAQKLIACNQKLLSEVCLDQ